MQNLHDIQSSAKATKNPSSLVSFKDARRLAPSASNAIRDIRNLIADAFDDDDFFYQNIVPFIQEPGKAGNRQMDQALVAERLFEKVDALRSYDSLTHKKLWAHAAHVLASYGYVVQQGRVTGHRLEYQSDESQDA